MVQLFRVTPPGLGDVERNRFEDQSYPFVFIQYTVCMSLLYYSIYYVVLSKLNKKSSAHDNKPMKLGRIMIKRLTNFN